MAKFHVKQYINTVYDALNVIDVYEFAKEAAEPGSRLMWIEPGWEDNGIELSEGVAVIYSGEEPTEEEMVDVIFKILSDEEVDDISDQDLP